MRINLSFTVLETEPFHRFAVPIKTEEYEAESDDGLSCRLVFTYTSKYPEVPLVIEIEDQENFEESDEEELKSHLQEQMKENLGMVMVFTLVSAAQEWLNIRWDKVKLDKEQSEAKKKKEEEEAEQVLIGNFWKLKLKFIIHFCFFVFTEKIWRYKSHSRDVPQLEGKVWRGVWLHQEKRAHRQGRKEVDWKGALHDW